MIHKWLKNHKHAVHFIHRDLLRVGHPANAFKHPGATVPSVPLPIDWTKGGTVNCPMDGNDQYGDCMYAMACHCDNIWTADWTTESTFNLNTIIQDYLKLSGGDNGLDEGTLVRAWEGGIASVPAATIIESLDIDVNNQALVRYAMANNFPTCLMWSVPDAFLNDFTPGNTYDVPAIPDPNNGHGTPLFDVDANGNYRLWTWGAWVWVTPAFVAAVEPSAFVVFSTRSFNPATGLDAKGVHITVRAANWVACGGKAIPASVIQAFPPAPVPPAPVPPAPVPPAPVPPAPVPPAPVPVINTLTISGPLAAGTYQIVDQSLEVVPQGTKQGIKDLEAAASSLASTVFHRRRE